MRQIVHLGQEEAMQFETAEILSTRITWNNQPQNSLDRTGD